MSAMNSPVVVPGVPVVEKTNGRGKKAKVSTEPVVDAVVEDKSKSKGRAKKVVAQEKSDADADSAPGDADKPRKNLIAKHALLHAFTLHLAKTSLDYGLFDQDLFDRFLASQSFFLDIPSLHNLFLLLDFKNLLKNAKNARKTSRKPTVSPDAPSLPAKKAKKEKVVKEEGEVKEKKPRKPRQPKAKATAAEGEAAPAPEGEGEKVKKEWKPRQPKAKAAEPAVVDEIPAAAAGKEKKPRQTKANKEVAKPEPEPVAVPVPAPVAAEQPGSQEGELEVRELVFKGVTYLLDDSNILYANDDTFEVVGKYDPVATAVLLNK